MKAWQDPNPWELLGILSEDQWKRLMRQFSSNMSFFYLKVIPVIFESTKKGQWGNAELADCVSRMNPRFTSSALVVDVKRTPQYSDRSLVFLILLLMLFSPVPEISAFMCERLMDYISLNPISIADVLQLAKWYNTMNIGCSNKEQRFNAALKMCVNSPRVAKRLMEVNGTKIVGSFA